MLYLVGEAAKLATIGGKLASDALHWGESIVSGLIDGITRGGAKLYKSVGDMAGKVGSAFRNALGIHSPSKAFQGFGIAIGLGTEKGIAASMPDGADIASGVIPSGAAMQIRGGAGATAGTNPGPTASGGQSVQVTIERLEVPRGEDPSAWMRAAGHELGLGIQAILLGQGAPA
jgi:hypothetical protein